MTDTLEEYEETSGWRLLEHVKMKIPRANFGYTIVFRVNRFISEINLSASI